MEASPSETGSDEPVFNLKVHKTDGKLKECPDDGSSGHSKEMVAYCKAHQVLICSKCMFKKHKACLANDDCIAQTEIADNFVELSEKVKNKAESYVNSIKEADSQFDKAIESIDENTKNLGDFVNTILETVKSLVKNYQKSQSRIIEKAKEEINEKRGTVKGKIDEINEVVKACDANEIDQASIPDLLDKYDSLKDAYERLKRINLGSFEKALNDLKSEKSQLSINFDKGTTKSNIESAFKKILGSGASVRSCQSTNEYLYMVDPLSTYLTLIDITNNKATIKDLVYEKEPFNVPYGASSIFYNNRVIITGGTLDFVKHLTTCYEYSILMEQVTKEGELIVPSSYHAMVEAKGSLYVLGGKNENGYLNVCESCVISLKGLKDDSELYNWKEIATLNEAKYGVAACVFEDTIYAFGGIGYVESKVKSLTQITQASAFSTIEKLKLGSPKWEMIGKMENLSAYFLGVIEGKYKDSDGFYIFGGLYAKNDPMKDTYFLKYDGLEECKDRELIKIENCQFEDEKGLANRTPVWQIGVPKIWVVGKSSLKYMSFSEENSSPVWNSYDDYSRQLI